MKATLKVMVSVFIAVASRGVFMASVRVESEVLFMRML